ncbi:MAG: hypothetical protein ACT4OF_02380 [Caulobacteraceae bacterium]
MRRVIVYILASCIIAGAAWAQAPGDTNGDRQLSRIEIRANHVWNHSAADANRDSFLDGAELGTVIGNDANTLAQYDADGDGKWSAQETEIYREALVNAMFTRCDSNRDELLAIDELRACTAAASQ